MRCPYGTLRQHLTGEVECEDEYCIHKLRWLSQTELNLVGIHATLRAIESEKNHDTPQEKEAVEEELRPEGTQLPKGSGEIP